MDDQALRLLIRSKLSDGRLPQNSIPRVWGGSGTGETCDACEENVTKNQYVMEGVGTEGGGVQLHVKCFYMWDAERVKPGHEGSRP